MSENDVVCQLNDFLKELKAEYGKAIASQSKRIMFLLDERNFVPNLVVDIDTQPLKSILGILVNNAVKYTGKGYIKIGYRILECNVLQFFVEDTGNGFDPLILEEMTKFFSSSDNDSDEAKNNLARVNQLVKSMGGRLRIESQQGMGTTVFFTVDSKPINVDNDSDESQSEDDLSQTRKEPSIQTKTNSMNKIWEGKTILIAEDEIVNYMFLEVLFEETGATLIHASDGRLAIDAVKSNPEINIILMDIKMPNINGLDATKQIKAIRPHLPVIAQTAYAMQDDEYKALQAGCNDYISKPIDANKLINLMKKYLR